MSQFATAAELRTFLDTTKNTGRYADSSLDMLLQAASDFLERETGRTITATASNTTRTFSTNGQPYTVIPDLRAAHSNSPVSLQSTTLDENTSFWLIRNRLNPNVYTGLQLRAFGTARVWDYRSNPEWFDRNLDSWLYPGNWGDHRLPNDLTITGVWGWMPSDPGYVQWKHAAMVLAGWYTKRPEALLANSSVSAEEGIVRDYSQLPPEITAHIEAFRLGDQVTVT